MNLKQIMQQTLEDVRTKLKEEFDKNFERKAFFDKRWNETKLINKRGSLMMRSGKLRRSINAKVQGNSVIFTSNMPYAALHNEGGVIKVTQKMKKFFWAKYIEAGKKGIQAEQFKALALKKVGDTIAIEQRQFIGEHPMVYRWIRFYLRKNIKKALDKIT
ncbi:phage virion morphogenesis protein [Capnocytophaga catalasegens]|uniref:Uncharacterized protein n=1 Tax=Capnocytophaga catalasegens TaxID=1004260 RepID=A0AAV5AXU7_9FLAO|nr:phage virion morphogenesis protein [Capnocytophaga catalasegens]GIZ15291.1 hypothetical protein RCZ03_12910 [Capnocytophaga catalasegens]GJM51225.1 hypothetical protein RCZ15_21980 [Capnocytophaga catalasegens]GJM53019.1 hypothetical protein RCZ16_13360 [Capnocytophaga catalasegens]